ncbi:MAG: hypothetical protein AAF108_08235 [Planctomycetota bacterium]
MISPSHHTPLFELLLDEDVLPLVVGLVLGSIGIVFGTMSSVLKHLFRERSRREIAAYIAEGSMTPEQGVELMKAKRG